jgi:hypothetical protein
VEGLFTCVGIGLPNGEKRRLVFGCRNRVTETWHVRRIVLLLHLQSWLIRILPTDRGGHVGATDPVRHLGLGIPRVGAMRELWKVLLRDRQSGGLILLIAGHRRNRRHGMGRAGWSSIAESMYKSGRWGGRLVSGCRCMLCRVVRCVRMVVRRW